MSDSWEYGEDAGTVVVDGAFPWPPPDDGQLLASFGQTWKGATLRPTSFFSRIPRDQGTGAALLYYLIVVMLVAGATLFWDSFSLFAGSFEEGGLASELGLEAIDPLTSFLLTPGILLVMLYVAAGVTHLLLRLLGDGRHGFDTTLRVFCYAHSPALFGIIPLLGGLVGSIWMVVLLVIGLREAQGTDGWKAALAVLLPFMVLMGLMIVAFMILVATGVAIMGGVG